MANNFGSPLIPQQQPDQTAGILQSLMQQNEQAAAMPYQQRGNLAGGMNTVQGGMNKFGQVQQGFAQGQAAATPTAAAQVNPGALPSASDPSFAGGGAGFVNPDTGALASGAAPEATAAIAPAAEAGAGEAAGGAGGAGIIGDLASIVAWIVCTQLMQMGRMPVRHWIYGSRVFAGYSDRIKRGYYFFAIPAVLHLRKHPDSWLSSALELVFCARAEYLAARAGCRGARATWFGAACTHGLIPIGWITGTLIQRRMPDWRQIYRGITP